MRTKSATFCGVRRGSRSSDVISMADCLCLSDGGALIMDLSTNGVKPTSSSSASIYKCERKITDFVIINI